MSVSSSEEREWEQPLVEVAPTVASEPESEPEGKVDLDRLVGHDIDISTAFPDEWKREFEGLLYLGYLEAVVKIPNHTFVVRTLLPVSKIELATMLQDLQQSHGYGLAYMAAVTAAALEEVDGRPIIVASRLDTPLRQKYQYVINSWYEPVIQILYQAVDKLEARQALLMRELGVIQEPSV